ncbi:hypothetical protein IFM89_036413 [Coptis chinensis]|uniref:DUF4283 domain-containing protein n=1 Tax=Coptis chinensis TaxID=261450 RepID=A0A835M5S4_9MAGN|nr:hypothetical protein IFM89_036413 [Coptis chinensis]
MAHIPSSSTNPSAAAEGSSGLQNEGSWSSLFRDGSSFTSNTLRSFETHQVDGVTKIPASILEQGVSYWSDYVVGFFVEKRLPFPLVKTTLAHLWKIKGSYTISIDRELFSISSSIWMRIDDKCWKRIPFS